MSFLKRKKATEESNDTMPLADNGRKRRECLTIGAAVNYTLAVLFVAIFLCSIIVIATMGVLQADLDNVKGRYYNGTKSVCYLYTGIEDCAKDEVNCTVAATPGAKSVCDGLMSGFGIIAVMSLAFLISLITKAVLNHDLNITLFIEVPSLIVFLLLSLSLSIALSIGTLVTCNNTENFYGKGKCSNQNYPRANFKAHARAVLAQNTSWFLFMFLLFALVSYIVRLVIFLRRRKKSQIRETVQKEEFTPGNAPADYDGSKAI